ncbi:MAG TPA: hypothetical protein VNT26_13180, partial [Candidatus Sulfotelmatobacter sp.]|nr:hypothetical protein [Candidatus Sulfotelmatobacter sp.]
MRSQLRSFSLACALALACLPNSSLAANLTTSVTQAAGDHWNLAIWKTNGTGTAVVPVAGNTYELIFNGTPIGDATANTRLRNPTTGIGTIRTFPGDSLTLNTNTELRAKGAGIILNFPGVGANPGLILNGGMLNGGDDTTFVITGKVKLASQSYISHGASGGGGGVSPNRAFNFTGLLSGTGNLVILNAGTVIPQQVSGPSNTFSGQWIVQCGWLLGAANNALGTNSITVDPLYSGYLAAMPAAISPPGPAWFEVNYDLNSAGTLTLTNGGVMLLHQNCTLSALRIEGNTLSLGKHTYAELVTQFPYNFAAGGSGSITVQPYNASLPSLLTQPSSVAAYVGTATQLVAAASGALPLSYQWQKGTNGVFVTLADGGDVSGSRTNTLSFSALVLSDAADYRLRVTNAYGAVTSQVATLTVSLPDTNGLRVTSLTPPAGATVNSLTQIQVTFSTNVLGVDAE